MSDDAQAETPQTPDAPSDQSDVSPPEAGNQAESSGGAESPRGGEKRPAEEGHEPDPGAYVPQKRGGTSSAEPPPDDAADDDVAKAKERSYEKVTGRQSGKATDDDDRRGLDHDRDAAFADPATSQRIAKESTIILRHGLTPSYSAVSLGDYSPAMTQTVVVNLESRQIKVFKGTFAPPQLDRILRPHVRVDEFEEMRNEK